MSLFARWLIKNFLTIFSISLCINPTKQTNHEKTIPYNVSFGFATILNAQNISIGARAGLNFAKISETGA